MGQEMDTNRRRTTPAGARRHDTPVAESETPGGDAPSAPAAAGERRRISGRYRIVGAAALTAALVAGVLALALPATAAETSETDPRTDPSVEEGAGEGHRLVRQEHLAEVLAPLVADGTLSEAQRDAVVEALVAAARLHAADRAGCLAAVRERATARLNGEHLERAAADDSHASDGDSDSDGDTDSDSHGVEGDTDSESHGVEGDSDGNEGDTDSESHGVEGDTDEGDTDDSHGADGDTDSACGDLRRGGDSRRHHAGGHGS